MRMLIINDDVKRKVAEAIEAARLSPVDYRDPDVIERNAFPDKGCSHMLSDRPEGFDARPASHGVIIEDGYRVAVSFELQPAGVVKHISISVDRPGFVPDKPSILLIMGLFGMPMVDRIWLEEFEPGHQAVNIIYLEEPAAANTG